MAPKSSSRFLLRWALGAAVLVAALTIARHRLWQPLTTSAQTAESTRAREHLTVGFLPVTCHLTCPVTDYATRSSKEYRYHAQRFTDFPTVAESIKSGRLEASFMIVPMAMKLREQGVPIKIVYLGHRDGSTVMVRSDLAVDDLRGLRGKRLAIPSKFSNQYLVMRMLMKKQGMRNEDIELVELPPPDMPGALSAKAIDAYFVGEPFPARAELNGDGKVLYHVKDVWPRFISCALVVHERLIERRPNVVADLVRGIAESGEWAETHRSQAAQIAAPYFRQDEAVVRHVLTRPPDRVSYRMLTPTDADLQRIGDMALEAGIIGKPVELSQLVDRRFIPRDIAQRNLASTDAPASAH
ncbi:NitT/TauT family transport system substrate-binding protein [Xanthomonas translucens]